MKDLRNEILTGGVRFTIKKADICNRFGLSDEASASLMKKLGVTSSDLFSQLCELFDDNFAICGEAGEDCTDRVIEKLTAEKVDLFEKGRNAVAMHCFLAR